MSHKYRVVGVGFDHMHIGDQLALAFANPAAEVVGAFDASPARARTVLDDLGVDVPVFADLDELLEETVPEIAFVCSTTADHVKMVETLARHGVHMILEKPMADSNAAIEAMVAAARAAGVALTVNWPLAWVESHRTARRLVREGAIGRIEQVHFYDGNRGPLYHSHGKVELTPTVEAKAQSWWYQPESGGGSLRDYLGYGTTLGTWFRDGEMPSAVTAAWHIADGLKVDEQSVVIAHYADGLSVFETRWGTHTDPWTLQPDPRCGFVINGSEGSISSWDYDTEVTLHRGGAAERVPNDEIPAQERNALANLIAHLEDDRPLDGPMTAEISAAAQRITECAIQSARTGRTVSVMESAASPYGSVSSTDRSLRTFVTDALARHRVDQVGAIGLVGCGWIGAAQLDAYRAAGLSVVALCDQEVQRAADYRDRYFPGAAVYESLGEILRHPGLDTVDVATHVAGRPDTVRQCLAAGKHVLSQKPFVEDLETGLSLAAAADESGTRLAVNQNGRWAPHFGAMLAVVEAGIIGTVVSADFSVAWPHDEIVAGKPTFETMNDLVLFDFGAHWFDLVGVLAPAGAALSVRAVGGQRSGQAIPAPLQASAIISGEGFISTLDFRAGEALRESGSYRISGTAGVLTHLGGSLGGDCVVVETATGEARIAVSDNWFRHGLAGAMLELLDATRAGRAPSNSAESSVRGLEIAFAALESVRSGGTVAAGSVRTRSGTVG